MTFSRFLLLLITSTIASPSLSLKSMLQSSSIAFISNSMNCRKSSRISNSNVSNRFNFNSNLLKCSYIDRVSFYHPSKTLESLSKQTTGGGSCCCNRIASTKLFNSANENSNNNDAEKNDLSQTTKDNNKDDDDDENNPNLLTYEELIRDPQYAQIEYNKARQRRNNLFLMQDIGKAFNVLLYAFVITSILLQTVGYGFVVIPDQGEDTNTGYRLGNSNVKIDTLENKAFLMEMNGQDQQAERIRRKYLKNYNEL